MKKSFGNWVLGFGILILGFTTLVVGCAQTTETATATTTTTTASTTTTTTSGATTTTSGATTTTSGATTTTSGATTTTTSAGGTTTTTTSTTSTTAPSGATVAISGTLKSGALTQASLNSAGLSAQASAFAALQGDTVVAVSKDTGKVYFPSAETDSSGSFTIPNLPAAEDFYLEVLDSNNRLIAPVAFGSSGGKAVMAITPGSTNRDLGDIAYSETKGAAVPATAPTGLFDLSASVEAKDGETLVPKGAGNFGKGSDAQFSGIYDSSKVDGDRDGLPNLLDADNNGDRIIDEFDGFATKETLSSADTKVGYSAMWTNVKVPYGSTVAGVVNNPTGYWIIISVDPKAGYTISNVTLEAGPSWVQSAKIHQSNSADGSNTWQSVGYKLYSVMGESHYQVILGGVEIAPSTVVKAGDILTLIVSFSDGSAERIAKMINFAIADVPKVKGYYSGQYSSTSDFITVGLDDQMHNLLNNTSISSEVFSLKWQKATDESGTYLEGATYQWEVGDGNWVNPTVTTEVGSPYVYGYANLASHVLITAESFGCAIGMVSCMGDNAVQNCAFKKTTTWGTTEVGGPPKP